jgi:hypothetical protein
MSLYELEKNHIKWWEDSRFPNWKLDAADWGQRWALKVFSGHRIGERPALIKWFSGEPTSRMKGCVHGYMPDQMWISAELRSWEDTIFTAAHEQTHLVGYESEDVPNFIGRWAVKDWAGERRVFIKHGYWPRDWMPEGFGEVPHDAVLLVFDEDGDPATAVNFGTPRFPSWRRAVIP